MGWDGICWCDDNNHYPAAADGDGGFDAIALVMHTSFLFFFRFLWVLDHLKKWE